MCKHNEAATVLAATANDFPPVSACLGHCDVDVFQEGKGKGLCFCQTAPKSVASFYVDAKLVQPTVMAKALLP